MCVDRTQNTTEVFETQGAMDKRKKNNLRTITNNCHVITEQKNLRITCQGRILWAIVAGGGGSPRAEISGSQQEGHTPGCTFPVCLWQLSLVTVCCSSLGENSPTPSHQHKGNYTLPAFIKPPACPNRNHMLEQKRRGNVLKTPLNSDLFNKQKICKLFFVHSELISPYWTSESLKHCGQVGGKTGQGPIWRFFGSNQLTKV